MTAPERGAGGGAPAAGGGLDAVVLLRHGQTSGNALGRYLSSTDEPLTGQGRAAILALRPPAVARVYTSPLLRCRQSAALLYPGLPAVPVEGLRECGFGRFENKNFRELAGDPDYQRWVDSGGTLPFPGGESRDQFVRRTLSAFQALDLRGGAAIVAHGGTLMALMSELWGGDYFDYQTPCATGFLCRWDGARFASWQSLGRA